MKALFFRKVEDFTYGEEIDWMDEQDDVWVDDEDEDYMIAEEFEVKKTIILSKAEFINLLKHPLVDNEHIVQFNKETDYSGEILQCILFRCKEHKLGLLVNPEGFDYARYGALVNADSLKA